MIFLTKDKKLQQQKQEVAHARHLPYREIGLLSLVQRLLAGYKTEKPLSSWIAYQERGLEKSKQGDFDGAIIDFTAAIQRGPKNTALQYLRGTTLAQLGEHDRALEDFKVILISEPGNKTVQALLKQSEDELSKGLSWVIYQTRGLEKIKNGDLEGAVIDFTQAIKNGPKNNALYYMRGTTFAKLKKYQLAISDFKNILKDEPNNETVNFVLKQCQANFHFTY